jgi:two-component system repressor protein LuxO
MPDANHKPSVLLVEDAASLAMIYQQYLRNEPISLTHTSSGLEARKIIAEQAPDLVLLDLGLPDIDGVEVLKWIHQSRIPTEVVIITSDNTVDTVIEVMKLGAIDFLEKPFDGKRLRTTVKNALKQVKLKHYVDDLKSTFSRTTHHGFIGSSLAMQAIYRIIDAAAPSKATVMIMGESGTGKEVCAEAIHKQSPRANAPFIALNCGAIPRDLMESEIFGHTKGAFTGALTERAGAAAQAHGGTLFLDEIAEMDMDLQTKLLRFIQTGRFKKVGGNKEEPVDIRIICATNKDPLEEVANGRFREDLYYRLHVIPIQMPPLRDRGDDVLELAEHFLKCFSDEEGKSFLGFSDEVVTVLMNYDWPGNVRQLQNIMRNIVVLHNAERVSLEQLPPPLNNLLDADSLTQLSKKIKPATEIVASSDESHILPLEQVERNAIEQAISFCDGNIPMAAALLKVSPSTIYRKKSRWS